MRILLANFSKMAHDTGGLAKVTAAFAAEMARRGHSVSLVFVDPRPGELFYPVPGAVRVYNLCRMDGGNRSLPFWLAVKREMLRPFSKMRSREVNDQFLLRLAPEMRKVLAKERPEVIVASQPAATRVLIAGLHTKIPVITMSHGDPEDYFHIYPKGELPALRKSAACQVLLPSFAAHITRRFPEMRVAVIGNVVPQYAKPVEHRADRGGQKKILFVGRLVKNHKRPHLLLAAFAMLAAEFPDWELELWGAESRKSYTEELRLLIARHHLERRARLMGTTDDIESVLRTGAIFVLPSAYEGFGLALAEAMSMGLPVVGYASCPAVNELIRDGENGLLCADGVPPLADALRRLMQSEELRTRLGAQGRADMRQYAAAAIWEQWEQLLAEARQRGG